ncbi:hypothetical protein BGW39_000064 [Mortierella sp. 14UC]|nr:hypothetical protein BGW39_000064 [Mortierella sp. 14UC]
MGSNSLSTRPKATITVSTSPHNHRHHHHHDFRIRPFLFSPASTAALRHTKNGQICKSTRGNSNNSTSRNNTNRLCVLPAATAPTTAVGVDTIQLSYVKGAGIDTHRYQAPQELETIDGDHSMGDGCGEEEEDEEDDDEDETEDVEIDIDGVGRPGYGISNSGSPSPTTKPSTALGNSATAGHALHTPATTPAGQGQLFGHEEFEFRTGPGSAGGGGPSSASASAFFLGSGSRFESSSRQQQTPSLSSSVCSTSSTLSTPPADAELDYTFNHTGYPQHQQKAELVKLKREAFQELACQTQRFDDLFIAKMIQWESLCPEEKTQWLERGHNHHDGGVASAGPRQQRQQQQLQQELHNHQYFHAHQEQQHQGVRQPRVQAQAQEQEMDDLVNALECRATVKDYSALIAFEQQAEIQRRTLMEQF